MTDPHAFAHTAAYFCFGYAIVDIVFKLAGLALKAALWYLR